MAEARNVVREIRQQGRATIVVLSGEVDLHHTPEVHKALVGACQQRPERLVINLSEVGYMDSSGIGTLVEIFRRVKSFGGKLVLCGLNERVYSVFEITRLNKFFEILETEEEALGA
ncbi:MAG: STAS domain-containing protein [Phycisphaerae bacterium]|nr:STAS domain-containing protein [Phycisphaerae bacterium]